MRLNRAALTRDEAAWFITNVQLMVEQLEKVPQAMERRTGKVMKRLLEETKGLSDDLERSPDVQSFDVMTSPKERRHLRGLLADTLLKLRLYIKGLEGKNEEPTEGLSERTDLILKMIRKFR